MSANITVYFPFFTVPETEGEVVQKTSENWPTLSPPLTPHIWRYVFRFDGQLDHMIITHVLMRRR